MKRLIADVYKIIYQLTHIKQIALFFSFGYVTLLNLISIYGLALLLSAWLPTKFLLKLFNFPYHILTAVAILLLNIWLMTPIKNMHKERKQTPYYPTVIGYTLITIVLCAYIHYRDRIF